MVALTASQCSVQPASVVLLEEIGDLPLGQSVRIVANVVSFDAERCLALVEMNGVQIQVATDIMVCRHPLKDLFGFIGEIEQDREKPLNKVLRARIAFRLHGLHEGLYQQALITRRAYLRESR